MSERAGTVRSSDASVAQVLTDPVRLAELRDSDLLDSEPEENFDRITKLAERLLDVPVALVSLVDSDRQYFKSQVGLTGHWAERETPIDYSFCQYAVSSGERLVVPDARNHPLVSDNPAIEGLKVEAYAGAPLATASGNVLGAFCVIEHEPRTWMDWELEVLSDLAALAITEIDFRIRSARLREVASQVAGMEGPIQDVQDTVQSLVNVADRAGDPRVERLASLGRQRLQRLRASTTAVGAALSAVSPDIATGRTGAVSLGERLLRAVRLVSVAVPEADLRVSVLHRPLTVEGDPHDYERRLVRLLSAVVEHAEDALVEVVADRDSGDTGEAVVRVRCSTSVPVTELTRLVTLAHAVRGHGDEADASMSTGGGMTVATLLSGRAATGSDGTEVVVRVPLRTEPGAAASGD